MGSLVFAAILIIIAIIIAFIKVPSNISLIKKIVVPVLFVVGGFLSIYSSVGYNQAGYNVHIQTIFGTEDAKIGNGWYFAGWGITTTYPQYITVAHTTASDAEGTSINAPYQIRMADNWNGTVTQTTRFQIPFDREAFIKMHNTFRGADSLVTRTLRPAVLASLDSVANLYSMEEYYAGGKRDQFKTEYRDAITQGRARVRQVSASRLGGDVIRGNAAPNSEDFTQDESVQDNLESRRVVMEKVMNSAGQVIREPHDFMRHGIIVDQAILENLDPDDRFEAQIQARKDAASRRIVAQEERREQEEQRLLAIQRGETKIAEKQAEAEVVQIERTTNAETEKQLALIQALRIKEEAEIAKQTATINLERARIDAEAVEVAADAEAYAKAQILQADNALAQKLEAEVEIQALWADAFAKRNVPMYVFGSGGDSTGAPVGSDDEASRLFQILTLQAAERLDYDRTIAPR